MAKHHNRGSGRGGRHRRDGDGRVRGRDGDRGGLRVVPGGPEGDGLLVAEGLEPDVLALRADARALAAAEAKRLRRVVQIADLPEATWPDGPRPQMLHLDITVENMTDFEAEHEHASALGARLLLDRSDDPEEPLRVYADLAGHPFCIFVAPPASS